MPRDRSACHLLLHWGWCVVACVGLHVCAAEAAPSPAFLLPEQAFALRVTPLGASQAEAVFEIAPGYYLYRDRLRFAVQPDVLKAPSIPPGQRKFDESIQAEVEVHRAGLRVLLSLAEIGTDPVNLTIDYQGCADAGLCYPPQRWSGELRRNGASLRVTSATPGTAHADLGGGESPRAPSRVGLGLVAAGAAVTASAAVLITLLIRRKKNSTRTP